MPASASLHALSTPPQQHLKAQSSADLLSFSVPPQHIPSLVYDSRYVEPAMSLSPSPHQSTEARPVHHASSLLSEPSRAAHPDENHAQSLTASALAPPSIPAPRTAQYEADQPASRRYAQ